MYENYKHKHPIDVSKLDAQSERTYTTGPYACAIPAGGTYWGGVMPFLTPTWYTDWRDETLSWHLTCSFHAHLNPSPVTIVRGPDAKRFMSENFVNNVENFPIGIIKHGIMCLDNGKIATHGVILRSAEDEYECWWHAPFINYAFGLGDYDAELIDMSMNTFLFQLQGPSCLQILEEVTGETLSDIDYRHFRDSSIDGHKVRITRFGMAGVLAYEIHGETRYAREIYKKIIEKGNPHGIRPIGVYSYAMDHAEGGFPQINVSFMSAGLTDPGYLGFMQSIQTEGLSYDNLYEFKGSAGSDPSNCIFNPFEVGLGHCINWKHEFRGKAALQQYKANRKRDIVTLEWNAEDIVDIYASQFRPGEEPYAPIDSPGPESPLAGHFVLCTDLVFDVDGKEIGVSMGRTQSHYYRAMLSLASLDLDHRAEGTEVFVLWGDPGTRQKKVRAKVARFPYGQELANQTIDVTKVVQPV